MLVEIFVESFYGNQKEQKNWNNQWIDKLKEDQREIKADIAVIASTVLPKKYKKYWHLLMVSG